MTLTELRVGAVGEASLNTAATGAVDGREDGGADEGPQMARKREMLSEAAIKGSNTLVIASLIIRSENRAVEATAPRRTKRPTRVFDTLGLEKII